MAMYLASAALVLLAAAADAKAEYPRGELLIEVGALAKQVGREPGKDEPPLRVLDVRTKAKYESGHVPGALWVDTAAWSKAFATGQDRDDWAKRLGELGITPEARVIVYGDAVNESARVWWILHYWGVKDARLLNGGWRAWRAADGPSSTEVAKVEPVTVKLAAGDRLATKETMLEALKEKKLQIVDARSPAEFCGDADTAKRNGAIPSSLNLDYAALLDPETQRFKSADELTKLFREAGIDPAKPTATYCQSGGRASVMAFALELMGAKDVRNYYKSWSEWGNADDTPIVKPPKK